MVERPVLEPSSTDPIHLKYPQDTSLREIFGELGSKYGITILFDESFRDQRKTLDLVGTSFQDALDKLGVVNRLFYKVIDSSTVIIVPDNGQKHRQYDEMVLYTFFLNHSDVNTIANMFRTIAGIQRVQPNQEQKSITVRTTPDQLIVAQRILELNDKERPDVELGIEILAVPRDDLIREEDSDAPNTTFASAADYAQFKTSQGVGVLAAHRIRVTKEKGAELKILEEVPISQSLLTHFADYYRSTGIELTIISDVSMEHVIELSIKLQTTVRSGSQEFEGTETSTFGTGSVEVDIALKDGETTLMDTLFRVGDLENIFPDQTEEQSDWRLVLSVTPFIVRASALTQDDFIPLRMGTEQRIKVRRW